MIDMKLLHAVLLGPMGDMCNTGTGNVAPGIEQGDLCMPHGLHNHMDPLANISCACVAHITRFLRLTALADHEDVIYFVHGNYRLNSTDILQKCAKRRTCARASWDTRRVTCSSRSSSCMISHNFITQSHITNMAAAV
jgi:hypothetical protein